MSPQRFEGVTIEFAADYDLVSAALAMLAHGLCELPPDEREAKLEAFENGRLFAPLLIMSPSSLMKNLKSSAFVLRFSSSYKRSVRFGSEWSRLVATLPYSEPARSSAASSLGMRITCKPVR